MIAAPSDSRREIRDSKRAIAERATPEASSTSAGRAGRRRRSPVLARRHRDAAPPRPATRGRRRCRSTPTGHSRACSAAVDFDLVHVHDPFAPSARLGRPAPLPLAQRRQLPRAQRAHPLDPGGPTAGRDLPRAARRAHRTSCSATEELIERFFPGHYELIEPGADAGVEPWWPTSETRGSGPPGADRVLPRRGAGRAAAVPARDPPPRPSHRLGGRRLGPGAATRSASPSASATACTWSARRQCAAEVADRRRRSARRRLRAARDRRPP